MTHSQASYMSYTKLIAVSVVAMFTLSCGGGENSGLQPTNSTPNATPGSELVNSAPNGAPGVNRGLSGTISTLLDYQLWKLDLETGEFSKYPRIRFDQDSAFHNLASFAIAPVRTATGGFLLMVKNCVLSGSLSTYGCVVGLDSEAKTQWMLNLGGNPTALSGRFAMSRDGKMFAAVTEYNSDVYICIYDVNGRLLQEEEINTFDSSSIHLDWGTDGLLYYTREDVASAKIYFWDPKDTTTTGNIEFGVEGTIGQIAYSPISNKIAFESINFESSIYVHDISNQTTYRLVIADQTSQDQFFSRPEWSPDEKWILAEYHRNSPSLDRFTLIAIPSDSIGIVYDSTGTSPEKVPFEIKDNASETLGGASDRGWFVNGPVYWIE